MLLLTALRMIDGVEQGPEPEDVKAGWIALVVFLLLCAAVAFLGLSLVKQLRKAQAAKDAGVYGDEPVSAPEPTPPSEGSDPAADGEDHPLR